MPRRSAFTVFRDRRSKGAMWSIPMARIDMRGWNRKDTKHNVIEFRFTYSESEESRFQSLHGLGISASSRMSNLFSLLKSSFSRC